MVLRSRVTGKAKMCHCRQAQKEEQEKSCSGLLKLRLGNARIESNRIENQPVRFFQEKEFQ